MRIVKDHDERKTELLDAAEQLFYELGYEPTSVNAIIEKVGVSKGTFYHYFKSKEELLDCLAERAAHQSMEQMRTVAEEQGLDGLGKLNKVYEISRQWQAENMDLVMTILKVMVQDENLLLRHKIQRRSLELCVPVFSRIVAQAVEEGVFDTGAPEEVSEMILQLGNYLTDTTTRLFLEADRSPEKLAIIEERIALYVQAIERILGAPEGAVRILDRQFVRDFAKRYYSNQQSSPALDGVWRDG